MATLEVDRREFLSAVAVAAAAGVVAPANVAHAVSAEKLSLSPKTKRTLTAVVYTLFPHKRLGHEYYDAVVKSLDESAVADASFARLLTEGCASLDAARHIDFVDLSPGQRVGVLKGMEGTPFFATMRGRSIVGLYGNPLVYRMFGYEGPSLPFGGYIDRGFADIGWLPNS